MQPNTANFKPNNSVQSIGNNWHHLTSNEKQDDKNNVEEINHEEKLNNMVDGVNQFSFKTKTQFPLDPYPNEIIIDIHKVTVIYKTFISKDVLSIPIKDINKVEVVNDFFFASMEIVNGSQTTTLNLKWLGKDAARKAQAILQGLLVAYKNDIDISKFDPIEITDKLITLGSPVA